VAQEHVEEHLVVDRRWLGSMVAEDSAYFALKVRGDRMINAGILEGDYVIVRQQSTAMNGQIVVAVVGEDATVHRFFQEDGRIRLQPEHPGMEPILVTTLHDAKIVGTVVAVFRALR
jgi:repressor LexA